MRKPLLVGIAVSSLKADRTNGFRSAAFVAAVRPAPSQHHTKEHRADPGAADLTGDIARYLEVVKTAHAITSIGGRLATGEV